MEISQSERKIQARLETTTNYGVWKLRPQFNSTSIITILPWRSERGVFEKMEGEFFFLSHLLSECVLCDLQIRLGHVHSASIFFFLLFFLRWIENALLSSRPCCIASKNESFPVHSSAYERYSVPYEWVMEYYFLISRERKRVCICIIKISDIRKD